MVCFGWEDADFDERVKCGEVNINEYELRTADAAVEDRAKSEDRRRRRRDVRGIKKWRNEEPSQPRIQRNEPLIVGQVVFLSKRVGFFLSRGRSVYGPGGALSRRSRAPKFGKTSESGSTVICKRSRSV